MMKDLTAEGRQTCGFYDDRTNSYVQNPTDTNGLVDVDAKWLVMARLCFYTSVLLSAFMVL